MGIQGQNYMLWTSSDVSFDNLTFLLEHRLSERQRSHLTERIRPKVVVDASLLGYKVLGSNNVHASDYVWGICTALATRNIDVLIIRETKRHHSKRASQQRIAAKERDSIELMTCRMELSCSVDTKADLLSRLQDYIYKPDYKPLPPAPVTNHNTAMKLNDPNVYGLKMFLRQNKQPKPRSKSHTPVTPPVTPIGFQVLRYRAHVDRVEEFTDRLDSVSACHDKWNMAFEGAKVRSLRHLQLRNNTDNAETQSENGADGVEDDEDGGISVTMEGSDGVDQPTAVLPTVTTSRRDEQLCNLRRVMKKWLRRRNTGQSKREFAKDNGLTWGVLNKYIASVQTSVVD